MKRSYAVFVVAVLAVGFMAGSSAAHITDWITVNNDAVASPNVITNVGNSTIISGPEAYQTLGTFPSVTLNDGQFIELTATFSALGRTSSSAADLQRLRDQIRFGLFRAPNGDPLQAANLTGYIIEHRSETREIRTPIAAPATNQTPFVSGRSTALGPGNHSTAADPQFTSGTGNTNFTESDVVAGVDVTFDVTYRIARDGSNLDITASIAGTPGVVDPNATVPPGPGDGVFLEQFSLQDVNPAIDLSGPGSDDFDFTFNRVGFLMGGNIDLAVSSLPGDYNGDISVDAADYTIWRDTLTQTVTPGTGADGDGNGIIEQADYDFWTANFGRKPGTIVLTDVEVTSGAAAGLSLGAMVPEPGSIGLLTAAAVSLLGWLPRRR